MEQQEPSKRVQANRGTQPWRRWSLADRIARCTAAPDPLTGCRQWTGSTVERGRGMVWDGKNRFVTRVLWEIHYGDIPDGMFVCHRCDNPGCVEVSHLFLGTPRDNVQDMIVKGRKVSSRGEGHLDAKLTDSIVTGIRDEYSRGGISQRALAARYGVDCRAIWDAIHWKTWTHLTDAALTAPARRTKIK